MSSTRRRRKCFEGWDFSKHKICIKNKMKHFSINELITNLFFKYKFITFCNLISSSKTSWHCEDGDPHEKRQCALYSLYFSVYFSLLKHKKINQKLVINPILLTFLSVSNLIYLICEKYPQAKLFLEHKANYQYGIKSKVIPLCSL